MIKKGNKKHAILIISALLINPIYAVEDDNLYTQAIEDAKQIKDDEIKELFKVPTGTFSVVTFDKKSKTKKIKKDTKALDDIWVTSYQELKDRCKKIPKNKSLKRNIQKLLGLPLSKKKKNFLVIEVESSQLIRPCANPDTQKLKCSAYFPTNISPMHKGWYNDQKIELYKKGNKYPWTRLGYTCNWSSGKCEYGVSEFIIKKGVSITPKNIYSIEELCSD